MSTVKATPILYFTIHNIMKTNIEGTVNCTGEDSEKKFFHLGFAIIVNSTVT